MNSSSINVVYNMEEFLTYMVNALDPYAINITMSNLNFNQKSDLQFLSSKFCNDHGDYLLTKNLMCDCDIAFFGRHCNISGYDYWKKGWTAFQVIMTLIFGVLSIITWQKLKKNWKEEHGSFWKKIKRICRTPKYLVIINLMILCISIDPYRQKFIFTRVADRILNELIFSAAIYVFYILLIVWIGLYSAFKSEIKTYKIETVGKYKENLKTKQFTFYEIIKEIIIIVSFFIYPSQIIFSYFRGLRTSDKDLLDIFIYIIFGLLVIFIILFAYFTCRLKSTLSRSYEIPFMNKKGDVIEEDEDVENSKVDVNDEIIFNNKLKENTRLNMIVKNLLNPDRGNKQQQKSKSNFRLDDIREENEDSDEDSDLELEYENEMININLEIFDIKDTSDEVDVIQPNNKNVETGNSEQKQKKRDSSYSGLQSQRSGKEFVLTKNDMNIFNKVFRLSYLIIIVASFLTIFGLLIEHGVIISSPDGTITFIIIAYILELTTIIEIFFLFLNDIRSDEYNNLKIIGDIENYLKSNRNKNSKLKFDKIKETRVYTRFKSFMNIEV